MDVANHAGMAGHQHIFDQRARVLALAQSHADETPGEEIVVFRLGDGRYGLPARAVLEVQPLTRCTTLPGVPPFVVGLVNVRGRLLTALDLRPLLHLAVTPPPPDASLLIMSTKSIQVALLADAVLEVCRTTGSLTPTLSSMAGQGTVWLDGIDQHYTLLIDPVGLLADPRLSVNMEA